MKLSVVIPTLNEETALKRLLPYLRQHADERMIEIVVSDAGSKDHTLEIARKHDVKTVSAGIACRPAQLNAGADATSGDVLYFLHADTMPPPSFVDDIQQALETGHDAGCFRYVFRSKSWVLAANAFFTRFNCLICQGGDQSLFIKRSLFEKIGKYNERYVLMEDYEILKRIYPHTAFITLAKNATVSARKYEHNSYLRVNLANAIIVFLYRMNWPPEKLRSLYFKLINHPKRPLGELAG